jgi:mono/diheme cytochrome c family protein
MNFVKTIVIFSFIAIFVFACTETKPENQHSVQNIEKKTKPSPEATATVDELALGRKAFKENCVKCHKEDGTGGEVEIEGKTIKPDNLTTDKMKQMPDEKYIKYMVEGIPDEGMPSFKDILSDEEMKEVVKFIRKEIQK